MSSGRDDPETGSDAAADAVLESMRAWDEDFLLKAAIARHFPILVGEAPSRRGDPRKPLLDRAGRFLAEIAGIEFPTAYLRAFGRCNLLQRWPGRDGVGSAFDAEAGRIAAAMMTRTLVGSDFDGVLVLLGRRVADSFGVPVAQPWAAPVLLTSGPGDLGSLATAHTIASVSIPRPSGLSREWNDPALRELAGRMIRCVRRRQEGARMRAHVLAAVDEIHAIRTADGATEVVKAPRPGRG